MSMPTMPVPEGVELDWGDEVVEDERVVVEPLQRTTVLPPGSGTVDWDRIHAGLIEHRVAKGRKPDGSKIRDEDKVVEEAPITVLEPGAEVEPKLLPQALRTIANRASAAGWQVRCSRSKTHRAAVLYKSDSKGDSEEGEHSIGDVRWVAEDQEHWWVEGLLAAGDQKAAIFRLNYITRWKGEEKPENKPEFREFWDVVTGRAVAHSAGEFDDWFYIFVPRPEPKKKKATAPKLTEDERMLLGEEWSG